MRIGPVTFLLLVPALWAVVRGAMLWPSADDAGERVVKWAPPLRKAGSAPGVATRSLTGVPRSLLTRAPVFSAPVVLTRRENAPSSHATPMLLPSFVQTMPAESERASAPPPFAVASRQASGRFDLSAWMLVRGDTSPGLATAGQLGGSQAGVRARMRLMPGLHLAGRLSGPLRSRFGMEAAIGLDVRPLDSVPVTLMVERRIGLDRGGRDAFGIGAFGGFDRTVAPGLRLDGYAQAGVVGIRRRDGYVDGALTAEQSVTKAIGIGAGVWGGAQPGAARLDIGPQLVVHTSHFRIGAEWRQRVAGDARPGSGPVLSLGADF